jgi:broad specificity phosphatase PhoE|nr:Alpha-ribazole-5'-phosphate phosphatase (EC [uncultured bacterium]
MKIYVVRHGETDLNAKKVMQGWLDEPLNQNGRDLAALTGQAMKAEGIRFDECISSPLSRAKETVEIILRESGNSIPVATDDRIKEISFGEMEGRKLSEMGEEAAAFFSDPFGFPGAPGGERIRDVCERTQAFLRELISRDDGKTYLIGIHGCALRAMLNFLYDDPGDFWHGHVPYNCAVNIVEACNGEVRLTADDKIYYPVEFIVDRYAG